MTNLEATLATANLLGTAMCIWTLKTAFLTKELYKGMAFSGAAILIIAELITYFTH